MVIAVADAELDVVGGVDTHKDLHVAAALDHLGQLLGTAEFPTTPAGYRALLGWLRGFGAVRRVGVEGTGAWGAGLARSLRAAGVEVIEVVRPNRQRRHRRGKSDPADAEAAGRAVLAGDVTGAPKAQDGRSRPSAPSASPSGRPSGPARRRPPRSGACSIPQTLPGSAHLARAHPANQAHREFLTVKRSINSSDQVRVPEAIVGSNL